MAFGFATCERLRAFEFMEKFYPARRLDKDAPEVRAVLSFVEQDIVRIPDPSFHPGGGVVPGKNWKEVQRAEVVTAFEDFHAYALAQPEKTTQDE